MNKIFCLIFLLLLGATIVYAEPTTPAALEAYLKQLNLKAQQPTPGEFQFTLGFPDGKKESFLARALPQQKLVYIAILEVAQVQAKGSAAEASFRKLAELNYQFTVGKLEWEPGSGSVRLSYTFANEKGVDFDSFKAMLQTLLTEVESARKSLAAAK